MLLVPVNKTLDTEDSTVTVHVAVALEYVAVKVVSADTPVTVTVATPLLFVIPVLNEHHQKKC